MKSLVSNIYLILLISLSIRYLFLSYYPIKPITGDAQGYISIANNLLDGKGFVFQTKTERDDGIIYPSIRRTPFYPIIIAFFIKISNNGIHLLRLFQVFLDVITTYIIFILGKRLFSEKTGYIAAWIYTFHLPLLSLPTLILTEAITPFFSVIIIYLLIRSFDNYRKYGYSVLLGIAVGLSILIKPTIQLFLPFLFLITFFIFQKNKEKIIQPLSIALIISLIVISPWQWRNYSVFGTPFAIAFGGGQALYTGNHIKNDGHWVSWDQSDIVEIRQEAEKINSDPKMRLLIMDKIFKERALKSMFTHPFYTAKLFIKKFIRYIDRPPSLGYRYGAKDMSAWYFPIGVFTHIFHILIFIGFLFSFYSFKKELVFISPLVFVLYFILLHTITFSIARYNVPILPILCIYGSNGLLRVYEKVYGVGA